MCVSSLPCHRSIEGLVGVVQPFLDLVCRYTGMKATMIVGGPEPADRGRLNIIRYVQHNFGCVQGTDSMLCRSFHSETTAGPVQSNFGQAERAAYKEYVVPLYSRFLQRCYSTSIYCSLSAPSNSVQRRGRMQGTSTAHGRRFRFHPPTSLRPGSDDPQR